MNRVYENPFRLQRELEEAERRLSDAQAGGYDMQTIVDLYYEAEELRERVNFAWSDYEYDFVASTV